MKRMLETKKEELYHFVDGENVVGKNEKMSGDCTGLRGNCTGLSGDFDLCKITDEDRAKGIDLKLLVTERE